MPETILIVDDEEPVRRTFQGWLVDSGLDVRVIVAGDAEAALVAANAGPVDLAVLDWNLGSGSDGLRLLEDLVEFHPDLVAILITGYASQATPLEALRNGIRDYLDKNTDLTRDTFLNAVRKQLNSIVPAKRQRKLNASLASFRETVAKVLPLVKASAALNDPVPLTSAVKTLLKFAMKVTGAQGAALIVHANETLKAYDPDGQLLPTGEVPFQNTIAASALSLQEPAISNSLSGDLLPCEQNRRSVLAAAIPVAPGSQVVLELFDKPFTEDDRRTAAVMAEIGSELLRSALGERQTHKFLADAVEAALIASDAVTDTLGSSPPSDPPPQAVLDTLRRGLDAGTNAVVDADLGLELVTVIRELALRHGPKPVNHCVMMVRDLRKLLDGLAGD